MNKLESTSPKDALCKVWLKWASGSGEEDENVKSLQIDRQTTDKGDQKSSLELSVQVSYKGIKRF